MKFKRIAAFFAAVAILAALALAPSFVMASEREITPQEATAVNTPVDETTGELPKTDKLTEQPKEPSGIPPVEQLESGDKEEPSEDSQEKGVCEGIIIGFAEGEYAYHNYPDISSLAEAEELALTDTLRLRVKKDNGEVTVETVEVEWINVHSDPYSSRTECGVYCYEAIPLDEGYETDEFYAPARIVMVGTKPQQMRLMSLRSGAALSTDMNGTAYFYDTSFAVYTSFGSGGSREEFNSANVYDGFYCGICGNGGGGEGGGTPNTCTAPRIWVRGLQIQGSFVQIYHRHWTNMQDSGHAVWIMPTGNPYFAGWYTASDSTAPSAPILTANLATSIDNWTKSDVTISAGGSTDSGTRLTQGMTSPDNAGKGLSHYEYSDSGAAWKGLPANSSASVVQTANFSTSGAHEVTVRAVDKARNASSVSTAYAYIDKSAPEVTLSPDTVASNVASVTVTVNAKDEHSGIKSITTGDKTLFSSDTRATTASQTLEFTQNGTYSFTVTDNVGYTTEESISITNIDAVPPVIVSVSQTPDWERVSKPVTVAASDNVGVADYGFDSDAGGADITWSDDSIILIPANGDLYVFVRDLAGNISQPVSITVNKIDCVLPAANQVLSPSSWCQGNVSVTVTATDLPEAVSGILSGLDRIELADGTTARNTEHADSLSASFTVENNGSYTYTVFDVAGNSREYTAVVENIDRQAPDTVTVIKSSENNVWTADDVNIAIEAADTPSDVYALSGVYTVTLPDGSFTENTTGINSLEASYAAKRNGDYSFVVSDHAGNTHTVSVNVGNIDKTPPEALYTLEPSDWTATDVSVSIAASDDQSGVASIILPDKTQVAGDAASFIAKENGTYSVELEDKVGNKKVVEIKVDNIDRDAPALILSADISDWTNGAVNLSAAAVDATSEVSCITKPDGSTKAGSSATFTVTTNGTYEFKATDKAGNVGAAQIEVSNIDLIPPELILSADTDEWTKEPISIRIKATDFESGVRGISLPDSSTVPTSVTSYSARVNGRYVFVATDNAGNTTVRSIAIANIDTTPPLIDAEIDEDGANDGETSADITAEDDESGIDEIELPDGTKVSSDKASYVFTESGEYIICARDKAGNIATQKVKVIVVAKESLIDPQVKMLDSGISLFDFFCVLATLILLILMFIKRRNSTEDDSEENEYNNTSGKPRSIELTVALAILAASIILFFITQPMVLRFVFLDRWSLLFGALAVVDVFCTSAGSTSDKPNPDKKDDDEQDSIEE